MHVLFVHPNYPAQFRYVAPRLVTDYGWTCSFATANAKAPDLPGIHRIVYRPTCSASAAVPEALRPFHNGYGHAHGVYEALKARRDLKPDVVVAHSGFGSSLFLPYLYDAPVINFFEYFYRPTGQDLGYRPETPVSEMMLLRSRARNATCLLDLDNCDRGWSPNEFQRGLFPREYWGKIKVIPEGVDIALWSSGRERGAARERRLPDGKVVPAGTRIVTYVSRGFEFMRGFDVFMRAARRVCRERADVLFVVVGTDRAAYGGDEHFVREKSFRQHVLNEGGYDLSRFHFTGRVPEADLARLLSLSDLHVYLTVPFVPSWSLLNAMSCGCVVLASDQACVREYVHDGHNGLLCDFFDEDGIARRMLDVLADPAAHRPLGEAARATIETKYSLDVCLPVIRGFFEDVVAKGPRAPSERAERLVRRGIGFGAWRGPAARGCGAESDELPPFDGGVPFVVRGTGLQPVSILSAKTQDAHGLKTRATGNAAGKTVLFCWELGAGYGHLTQMRPLAEDLVRRGARVFVALRQLDRAAMSVFRGSGVSFLHAPCWIAGGGCAARPRPASFTQLLMNVGFGNDAELMARAAAWRNLFRLLRPDLIVFDFSPCAMLASRGLPARRATIGSGFCAPPDSEDVEMPWAVFRPLAKGTPEQRGRLMDDEAAVLERVNRALSHWKQPPLDRLGQLYSDVDENFLTTFPELDHFAPGGRAGAPYWGPVLGGMPGAVAPAWPDGDGKRLYVYLKHSPATPGVLEALSAAGARTVAFIDGLPGDRRERWQSATLRLEDRPIDLARAARECDAAVLPAGAGSTAEVLLAGKPVVEVPAALEQQMTADTVERLGAGVKAGSEPLSIERGVEDVLTDGCYAEAAERFARRYAAFDPAAQREAMVGRALELLSGGAVRHEAPAALAMAH